MIQSCVTVSLVDEARGGPFVYWDDLPAACASAASLGFDAVELFLPAADAIAHDELKGLLQQHELQLGAVGTGAGWVRQQLSLTDGNASQREKAREFVKSIVDLGGAFEAPAIIGSMQGRWGGAVTQEEGLEYLRQSLDELGEYAKQYGVPLIYEPLNRYETNMCVTIEQGKSLLQSLSTDNVALLADLFHMNIEETDLAQAIRLGEEHIGHVHFVDSNRRPAGCGHMDYGPISEALAEINYHGYASAEAFPYRDSEQAAAQTIKMFNKCFR